MLFVNACTDDDRIRAAPTVFVFQEVGVLFCGNALFKLLIDTHFTLGNSASTGQYSVYDFLRKSKGRGFLFLCLISHNESQLTVHRRNRFHCIGQFSQKSHCFKMLCDNAPVVEALSGSVFVFALPQVEDILKCFVSHKPAVV